MMNLSATPDDLPVTADDVSSGLRTATSSTKHAVFLCRIPNVPNTKTPLTEGRSNKVTTGSPGIFKIWDPSNQLCAEFSLNLP
jgi:hypothetical protein